MRQLLCRKRKEESQKHQFKRIDERTEIILDLAADTMPWLKNFFLHNKLFILFCQKHFWDHSSSVLFSTFQPLSLSLFHKSIKVEKNVYKAKKLKDSSGAIKSVLKLQCLLTNSKNWIKKGLRLTHMKRTGRVVLWKKFVFDNSIFGHSVKGQARKLSTWVGVKLTNWPTVQGCPIVISLIRISRSPNSTEIW